MKTNVDIQEYLKRCQTCIYLLYVIGFLNSILQNTDTVWLKIQLDRCPGFPFTTLVCTCKLVSRCRALCRNAIGPFAPGFTYCLYCVVCWKFIWDVFLKWKYLHLLFEFYTTVILITNVVFDTTILISYFNLRYY